MSALRPWYEQHAEDRPQLVNMYGITETTVHVTYQALQAADAQRYRVRARSEADCEISQLYVLDRHGEPVPVGAGGSCT